jgi:PAS domain S-box-containing protein
MNDKINSVVVRNTLVVITLVIVPVILLSAYSSYVLDNGLYGFVAGLVAVIVLLGVWIGRHILMPLLALKSDIQKLGCGNADIDLRHVDRKDEIGDLSRSLQKIKEYIIERAQMADMYEYQHRRLVEFQKQSDELIMRSEDAVVVTNAEGTIVQANKAAEKVFGYKRFDFIGRKVEMLIPVRYGNHEEKRNSYNINPAYRPMGALENLHGLRSDGSEFPVTISITPVESLDGKRFIAAIRDETQRKRREDELRKLAAVAENARNLIVISDSLGKIEWVNLAFENVTSLRLAEIRGRKLSSVLRNLRADDDSLKQIDNVLMGGGSIRMEIQSVDKNGNNISMDFSVQEVLGEKGVENFIVVANDVTERRKLQDMLVKANTDLELRVIERTQDLEYALEKADEAAHAKANFLATMSHEIRTPINGVMGMAELLKKTPLSEKQCQMLNSILSSSNILRTVIDDILDFSKIEAGKLNLESIRLSVRDVLHDVGELLKPMALDKSIEFIIAADPDLPEVTGDPVRLRQIIYNLVGNAIKFTPEFGCVWLRAELIGCHDGYVDLKLVIEDTGVGISQEDQKKLFQPFSQVDGSTTRQYGGTGLGLSIVLLLVELMNGSIDLVSKKGVGSCFSIYLKLPVAEQRNVESDVTSMDSSDINDVMPVSAPVVEKQGKKILVVDDNSFNQELFKMQLEMLGYESDMADNGVQALECLKQGEYLMVLTDYHMPEMDGLQLLKEIRRMEKEGMNRIPVISITADVLTSRDESGNDIDFDGYLTKPLSLGKLSEEVGKWS